jgi:hypothetical protein
MSERSQLSGDASEMISAWTNLQRQLWRHRTAWAKS